MKNFKQITALSCALILAVSSFSGCGKKEEVQNGKVDISKIDAITENTMPITKDDTTITVYAENRSRGAIDSYNNAEVMKELQKRTGITIAFQHPLDTSSDQLSLMLNSGKLPDVLFVNTYFYGGWSNTQLKKAAYDGTFIQLDEYIKKFAPNINKYLEKNPEVEASYRMFNPDGKLYTMPVVFSDVSYNYYDGYFIRKDWLDKLNLEVPDTIEEWENVLRAFVTQDPNGNGEKDEIGFSSFAYMTKFAFMPAFDVFNWNYYLDPDDNRITHGVIEPGMKDFIQMMNRWYEEGLVNPEYVTTDQKTLDYLVLNDKLGAFYCDYNNTAIKYIAGNPDMELVAVPFVANKKGERRTAKVGKSLLSGYGALISADSEHVAEIVRLIDYLFSDEGMTLMNWGIEGDSYIVDKEGNKQFTDKLKNDGLGLIQAYNAYTATGVNGGFAGIYDVDVNKAFNSGITKKQATLQNVAQKYCEEVNKDANMPSTPTTPEEDEEIAVLTSDLNTYLSEMFVKFMTGKEDINNYDKFVNNVKEMGIERILEIRHEAYKRGLKGVENILKKK